MPSVKSRRIVGLTGGMGSGKSTVLEFFRRKGARVLDADRVVHDLLERDKRLQRQIERRFGSDLFDAKRRLNRRRLAERAFASERKRRALERLVHPLVRRRLKAEMKKAGRRVTVVDVPLLYESGWGKEFDRVIAVDARTGTRIRRLQKKGFVAPDIRRRMKAQWPLSKKVRWADFVIDNNGTKDQTRKQVNAIWNTLTNHRQ